MYKSREYQILILLAFRNQLNIKTKTLAVDMPVDLEIWKLIHTRPVT